MDAYRTKDVSSIYACFDQAVALRINFQSLHYLESESGVVDLLVASFCGSYGIGMAFFARGHLEKE